LTKSTNESVVGGVVADSCREIKANAGHFETGQNGVKEKHGV